MWYFFVCTVHNVIVNKLSFGFTAISRPDRWVRPTETCLNTRRGVQLRQLWTAGPRNSWRRQVKLHMYCILLAAYLVCYYFNDKGCSLKSYILIHSLQILHGVNWCCRLPSPLPAALPGPTSSRARAGGRNTELRRHCHKLCSSAVFEEKVEVDRQH